MAVELIKVERAQNEKKGSGQKKAVKITNTNQGYRVALSLELLADIGVTADDFKKADRGIFLASDGNGDAVLYKDMTTNSAKISGTEKNRYLMIRALPELCWKWWVKSWKKIRHSHFRDIQRKRMHKTINLLRF